MRQSLAEWISQKANINRRVNQSSRQSQPVAQSEVDIYIDRVEQLFRIAKQQSSELAAARKRHLRLKTELEKTSKRLKQTDHELRTTNREFRLTRRKLDELNRLGSLAAAKAQIERINRLEKFALAEINSEHQKRKQAEAKLKEFHSKVYELQRKLDEQSSNYNRVVNEKLGGVKALQERDRRRKAEKETKNTKRQLKHARRCLDAVRREHSKCGRQSYAASFNGSATKRDFIGLLLPNLTLVRDGDSRLTRARGTKQIFGDLLRLNDNPQSVRGDRVGGAYPWIEMRPNPTLTDRIYYRQTNERGQYLVVIGNKNTQPNDIAWMRSN